MGTGACKAKLNGSDTTFPRLITWAVHVAGSFPKVALICSCELSTKLAAKVVLPAGATPTAGQVSFTCSPLTNREPLTETCCLLFDPTRGLGVRPLIAGFCTMAPS